MGGAERSGESGAPTGREQSGGRGQGGGVGSRERGVEGGGGAPWRPAKAEEVPAEALVLTLLLAFWGRDGGGGREWAAHAAGACAARGVGEGEERRRRRATEGGASGESGAHAEGAAETPGAAEHVEGVAGGDGAKGAEGGLPPCGFLAGVVFAARMERDEDGERRGRRATRTESDEDGERRGRRAARTESGEGRERRGRRAARTGSGEDGVARTGSCEDGERQKVPALKSGGDEQLQRAAVRVKRRVAVAGRVGDGWVETQVTCVSHDTLKR